MPTFEIIKDAQEQTNSENISVVEHQKIEKKCIRTVGNLLNGNLPSSITAAATISSTKVACTSYTSFGTGERKSAVSELCTSVERKDLSLHYLSRTTKVSSCVLPAGQKTIIHFDNYAQFIAKRATSVRVCVKRSDSKERAKTISCSSTTTTTTTIPSGDKEINVGVIDVDLKVPLGGVSSYCTRQQTINMYKQKVSAKAKSFKTPLMIELPKTTENSTEPINLKKEKSDLSVAIKPTTTKPKINRRRTSSRQLVKTNNKVKSNNNQTIQQENSDPTDDLNVHFSRFTQTEREWKILKPCSSLLQNKKCTTELTCPYLHSDFPCKYFYLSLPCPKGQKCQFMHNGPLESRLLEALRKHILDLLSSEPSCVETYFVQQMHQVDSLYQRLMMFQKIPHKDSEIIEVLDDCNGDQILISDDSSEIASAKAIPEIRDLGIPNDKLDMVYESFKETNTLLEQIDVKLKKLKNTSKLTSNEKLVELQKIYEILKEKEKLLPAYENVNNFNTSTTDISVVGSSLNSTATDSRDIISNKDSEEQNLIVVHSNIVNEKTKSLESEDNLITITDDESESEILQSDKDNNKNDSKDKHITLLTDISQGSKDMHEMEGKNSENRNEMLENSCSPSDLNLEKQTLAKSESSECHVEPNILSLNETVINLNKKDAIRTQSIDETQIEKDEVSPEYENITSPKHLVKQVIGGSLKENRICLRSHSQPDFGATSNSLKSKAAKKSFLKVKRRRLGVLKLNHRSLEKAENECEIKADPINKDHNKEAPLTQNTILSKRFLKKANKAHLKPNTESNDLKMTNSNGLDTNIERNMFALHNDVNIPKVKAVENVDVTLLTQTSDDTSVPSVNTSQDCLVIDSDSHNSSEVPTSSYRDDDLNAEQDFNQVEPSINELKKSKNLKRLTSIEQASSSTTSIDTTSLSPEIKKNFNLGNPYIVLTKLKTTVLEQMAQNKMSADSTTTSCVNLSNVTSSTLLTDEKTTQKRHSSSSEYDLDSSLKASKHSKMNNAENVQNSERRNDEIGEFHADVEKLPDATNALIAATERQKAFEPSLAHATSVETLQNCGSTNVVQQHEQNESDLRQQQIENVSNKSDLQLQSQQQTEDETKIIDSSFIAQNVEHEQREEKETKSSEESEKQIAKTCNPYVQEIPHSLQHIEGQEGCSTNSKEKPSNEPISPNEEQVEYAKYASLYNKLSAHTSKCQINFENSSVNITPIASPTYGSDAIDSPSPVEKGIDFHMAGEIDGRLTYPPIPYMLYEIDLEKIDMNRPQNIEKLKKTISLDPRIFRTSVKKQTMAFHTPTGQISNAPVPAPINTDTSTTSMVASYDPRIRFSAGAPTNIKPSLPPNQTALSCYSAHPMISSATAIPRTLEYNTPPIEYSQVQQQPTPNMFLYGCLQRSPWYQSLMSTMKIQINQSVSQLVRALNNFHRERLLNPLIVFDVFKIDCAGEILEIMRNLDIFIDSNGVINEQRQVPSFAGRSCWNNKPVNATYSFIQQVVTPNTNCTSMTTTSSTYNTSANGTMGSLNMTEPFVSCYIKPPDPIQKQQVNHNNNQSCSCKKEEYPNSNGRNYNQNDSRRNQFKKPYDNSNNKYQQRSNQSSYNNNPRFTKPSEFENRSSFSPTGSPMRSNDYDNGNSYNGGGSSFSRGRGGRFNNNNKKRFNNYNNNNDGGSNTSSDEYHSSYNSSNSPVETSSSPNSSYQRSDSPIRNSVNISPPKPSTNDDEEECWD